LDQRQEEGKNGQNSAIESSKAPASSWYSPSSKNTVASLFIASEEFCLACAQACVCVCVCVRARDFIHFMWGVVASCVLRWNRRARVCARARKCSQKKNGRANGGCEVRRAATVHVPLKNDAGALEHLPRNLERAHTPFLQVCGHARTQWRYNVSRRT